MPVTIYLDTSFLMLSAKFHIDVLSEAEKLLQGRVQFAVPTAVLTELEELARRLGASGRDARVALGLIQQRNIPDVVSGELDADTALIEASRFPKVIVATADFALRKKIRDAGKPVIFVREKAKLELDGIEASYW